MDTRLEQLIIDIAVKEVKNLVLTRVSVTRKDARAHVTSHLESIGISTPIQHVTWKYIYSAFTCKKIHGTRFLALPMVDIRNRAYPRSQ